MNFEDLYSKNLNFPNRYISPEKLFSYLQTNLSDYIQEIGKSTLGKPIYKARFGNGSIKVLAWSQMHGNESNSTLAMLDLLEIFEKNSEIKEAIFSKIQLDFIFMLNPDGSQKWTRRNALDIDLNRDFRQLSSVEFPILKNIAENEHYDYALNLHEQRTLFSTDGKNPATLSFLAPAENVEREITETRKKSMAVIARIIENVHPLIPHQIARYNDEFYPSSTGDNFTKMGIPTILYEGGHFPNDYLRNGTRKYYTIALFEGLKAISELNFSTENWESYFDVPENKEDHFDIIYRNVQLNTENSCVVDIAVHFKEEIKDGANEISFIPMVVEMGDCGKKKGWKEVDCSSKKLIPSGENPKMDSIFDFEFVDQ